MNFLCYRWHQKRRALGREATACRGEGNENWPSIHACQIAGGLSVPIHMNEDWRHSAPCMIKPKVRATFLIKIALPSSLPKGTSICMTAILGNCFQLSSFDLPSHHLVGEQDLHTHQLRASGSFKGSPQLLPLPTLPFSPKKSAFGATTGQSWVAIFSQQDTM